jgi:hypothetical protein
MQRELDRVKLMEDFFAAFEYLGSGLITRR